MSIDILVLNHATVDIRVNSSWVKDLVKGGGLSINRTDEISKYLGRGYERDAITFGGSGNLAPIVARAGLEVALAFNVGKGNFGGLDLHGKLFCDAMADENINLNYVDTNETLSTAVTLIDNSSKNNRGGMVYFPNANDEVDFERYKEAVKHLNPKVVHYLYVGLSKGGDKGNGKDLAKFLEWCNGRDVITSVDSHTLSKDVNLAINSNIKLKEYELLLPILPVTDIFFTSSDEAKMISNSLGYLPNYKKENEDFYSEFLDSLMKNNLGEVSKTKLFGVTSHEGAYTINSLLDRISKPIKVKSKFGEGEVVDLVGAGDSFRAGVLSYICKNLREFKKGSIKISDAIQMGNLFASNFIKSPLNRRYDSIKEYDEMCRVLKAGE